MYRRSILALVGVLVVAASLAIPAGAGSAMHTTATQKVYKSYMCSHKVLKYDPRSWACTTITVNPWMVEGGSTTAVTYTFKAKKTLKYVQICFSAINVKGVYCKYIHKFRAVKRGRVIKRVLQLKAPAVTETGQYVLDNYTGFYRRISKWAVKGAPYWQTMSSDVCIVSADQPNAPCQG